MEKDRIITVSEAVHKLQLALLDGIEDDDQLFAAGSLMSRSDYDDVVTERTIANLCGYPLCPNSLPAEQTKKGQYRISIKEHKVYDLHETYLYCCSSCLINSKAFAGSLKEERCSALNPEKVYKILRLFKSVGSEDEEEELGMGKNGELGLSKLVIKENVEAKGGEVSMEEWVGPSNAIEGYVPQRDRHFKQSVLETSKKGSELGDNDPNVVDFEVAFKSNEGTTSSRDVLKNYKNYQFNHSETIEPLLSDVNFISMIITNDEFAAPKKLEGGSKPGYSRAHKDSGKKSISTKGKDSFFESVDFMSTIITQEEYSVSKLPSGDIVSDPNQFSGFSEILDLDDAEQQSKLSEESACPADSGIQESMDSVVIGHGDNVDQNSSLAKNSFRHIQNVATSSSNVNDEAHSEKVVHSYPMKGKSSLRSSGARKVARSVSWADEKPNGRVGGNLCEFREFSNSKESPSTSKSEEARENDDSYRFASAEACAMALIQAAEAVASGESDATHAVSEAGIIVLPQSKAAEEGEYSGKHDSSEELASEKWPKKPGNLNYDVFNSDSSWLDTSPEGFSLMLSPFTLMWNALFSWLTSSSLAYIYGREENAHEEYMFTSGREYPSKIVLPDGRSPEIKQTLAGCLARALPGLIADLKLPTPVSTLEHEVVCLLDTMSFMDALPPFRMKQWQVIALLFIDALSVCRIPGLSAYLTSRRILIPNVLNGAQITSEEYEIMKDFMIPLGRVPQFSMQNGG